MITYFINFPPLTSYNFSFFVLGLVLIIYSVGLLGDYFHKKYIIPKSPFYGLTVDPGYSIFNGARTNSGYKPFEDAPRIFITALINNVDSFFYEITDAGFFKGRIFKIKKSKKLGDVTEGSWKKNDYQSSIFPNEPKARRIYFDSYDLDEKLDGIYVCFESKGKRKFFYGRDGKFIKELEYFRNEKTKQKNQQRP